MKKVLAISLVLFGVVFLAGCGQQQERAIKQTQSGVIFPKTQQILPNNTKVSELLKNKQSFMCQSTVWEHKNMKEINGNRKTILLNILSRGGMARSEEVQIRDDGYKQHIVNIVDPEKKIYLSSLTPNGSWTTLDYDKSGGADVVISYDNVPRGYMTCQTVNSDFDDIFLESYEGKKISE